jgi:hypothetical protein
MRFLALPLLGLTLVHCSSNSNDTASPVGGSDSGVDDAASAGGRVGSGGASGGKGGTAIGGGSGKAGGGGAPGGATNSGGSSPDASTPDSSMSPDASTPDSSMSPEASLDASPMDSGAADARPSASDAGPIAHFGQFRFVNLAPDSVPLDVCIKETLGGSYSTPVYRASGNTAGVPYASETAYVPFGITSGTIYDFVLVAASAASCAPPWLGAFGSLGFATDTSMTFAVFENAFPSSGNYSASVFVDQGDEQGGMGNVRFHRVGDFNAAHVDLHASHAGVSDELWFSDYGGGYGSVFHVTPPDQYSFRATTAGTQTLVAQLTGVNVVADASIDLFLFPSGAAASSLLHCPSRPSGALSACVP